MVVVLAGGAVVVVTGGAVVVVVAGGAVVVVGGTVVVGGGAVVVVGATVVVVAGGAVVVVGGTVVVVAGGAVVVLVAGAVVVVVAGAVVVVAGAVEVVVGAVVVEVDVDVEVEVGGTEAMPKLSPPPVMTAGSTATDAVVGVATAAGTNGATVGAAAKGAGATDAAVGTRTLGAATMLGEPSEARSGAVRLETVGSDGARSVTGVGPSSGAAVVGVEDGRAAKPGAARREPSGARSSSCWPTGATSPDVSASAMLRGWPPPRRPSVTAVTHAAVANSALPTARRRRRPRGRYTARCSRSAGAPRVPPFRPSIVTATSAQPPCPLAGAGPA